MQWKAWIFLGRIPIGISFLGLVNFETNEGGREKVSAWVNILNVSSLYHLLKLWINSVYVNPSSKSLHKHSKKYLWINYWQHSDFSSICNEECGNFKVGILHDNIELPLKIKTTIPKF